MVIVVAVAKQKSLFNDNITEAEQMTTIIKHDLQALTQDIDSLQQFVHRNKSGKTQTDAHSENVVNTLKSEVANATKNFAEILQIRSKVRIFHKFKIFQFHPFI